ncbi:hypothetical protein OIDMADRAFT_35556 [Oidiodendron maius Zn]|uniref:Uncharacterized protein n=1 Tax=Oidiodendron maius (strain Zn) TaxID=913774 RepID=A0A0C3GC53_OIDMZ|nr:hypothetical protein OIDMADRAFT_35556 [Oidiodendron maius Zn]
MMLCFALNRFHEGHVSPTDSCALPRRDEILGALTIAKSLWEKHANRSVEARKAEMAITAVLKQDFDMSSLPILTALDGEEAALVRDQSVSVGHPAGVCEQMPGQSYLVSFDFGQNLIEDFPFSTVDADMAAFGCLWDDS